MPFPDPFLPLAFLGNPHLQTILAARVPSALAPPSETRPVDLGDGDRLALEVSTPAGWRPSDPTVFLVHGLAGNHRSTYMVRMAAKLRRVGLRAVRINMRGCGSGHGLARRPYHGGCSDDVRAAIEALLPEALGPRVLIGFSLGGNVVLKLAAELGREGPRLLREVIAVCPPADLEACWRRINRRESRLYEQLFVSWLRGEAQARRAAFPDLDPVELPRWITLLELDDRYTAPAWGFAGAIDYYGRSSARPLVSRIEVPCRVLLAEDDPVIDPTVLDGIPLPSALALHKIATGGHLGFLASRRAGGVYWLDRQLLRWCGRWSGRSSA